MSLHVAVSLLALIAYVGLLIIIIYRSLNKHHASYILMLYLLNMIGIQIGYLVISLADTAPSAILGYTLLIPVASAQPILYFYFTQTFLHKKITQSCILGSFGVWLFVTVFSFAFRDNLIYPYVYRDSITGLFVPKFGDWIPLLGLPSILFFSLAIISLYQELKTARSALQRIRVQYLMWAIIVVIAGLASNFSPVLRAYPVEVFANCISAALMTYVILRYQLLGIPRIIRTSMLYAVPTFVIGIGYYLIIHLATAISQTLTDGSLLWLSFIIAALAAIVAQPLRNIAQGWLDRLFYREQYDGRLMIERLSHATVTLLDLDSLVNVILDEITTTLHIQWSVFFLQDKKDLMLYLVARRNTPPLAVSRISQDHPLVMKLAQRDKVLTIVELLENRNEATVQEPLFADLETRNTELFVPLKLEGKVTGILVIGPKQSKQSYTYDDELTLMTLANQTAIAIENARLHQLSQRELSERRQVETQIRHQAYHLQSINNLAIELASLKPDIDIYQYVAEKLKAMTNALGVGISAYNAKCKELVVKYIAMPSQSFGIVNRILERNVIGLRMPVSDSMFEEILREIVVIKSDLSELSFGVIPQPLAAQIHKRLGIGPFASFSLQYNNILFGTLFVAMSKQSLPLPVDLMKTIAHIVSITLQRKKDEDALRQRNYELEMLNRVGQEFNSTLELDLVLNHFLEEVRLLFDVVASSVWLLDAQTGELVCHQAAGTKRELILNWRLNPGQGLAGWAIEHAESIIVADAQADERYFAAIEKHLQSKFHSILVVPLRVKGNVIGVLEVMDNVIERFTQDDLTLVEALASTAATAIENARLYEQTRLDAGTKTALLKEVNHRVGNNLAAIIGLINAEHRYVPPDVAPIVMPTLERLIQRVQGLSEVHSMLTQSQWGPIHLNDLARQVIYAALNALPAGQQIYVTINNSSVTVTPRQSSNLALIINELATNTIKHALHARNVGHITFHITRDEHSRIVCEYRDDGPGFPPATLNLERYSVGIYLIQRLVTMALLGELTLTNNDGAVTIIKFESEERERT
jgi:GAF domain-containing protein/anti-sigma regulatory factor (Ser/Thr protein kinase)